MPWEPPELPVDQDEVTDRILDGMQTRLPGWVPVEGAVEVALAEEIGRETAATNAVAVQALDVAAAGVGETVFGFPAYLGAPATLDVQLTVNTIGAVVPGELTVVGMNPAGVEVAFVLGDDITAQTLTPTVTMTATEAGDYGNGVPLGDLTIVTSTSTVDAATALEVSSNGADPETIDAYLNRLVDQLSTLSFGAVKPADVAALARTVPGVHRALAVDLHNAMTGQDDQERTVSVFVVDEASQPVTDEVKADVYDKLEAAREPNFVLIVADPTYTPVAVAYTVVADSGVDPDQLVATIDTALTAYLTAWGVTPSDPRAWNPSTSVRLFDVARIIGTVTGVAYLATLTLNGQAADLQLDGAAPLPAPLSGPDPSTIVGTVL